MTDALKRWLAVPAGGDNMLRLVPVNAPSCGPDVFVKLADVQQRIAELEAECERLRIGHELYETARLMNPQQWANAWKINVSTGKPFDEIIDHLKPFYRPEKESER